MNFAARLVLMALLALAGMPAHVRAQALAVTSPAFKDQDRMPRTAGCEGGEHSPPLVVSGVPSEARTLALIMTELDSPKGGAALWMACDIPAAPGVTIAENQPKARQMKNGGVQLAGPNGRTGYTGPCPPSGVTRRYAIEVFALDTALNLPEAATKQEFLLAVEGHILAMGKITGKFKK